MTEGDRKDGSSPIVDGGPSSAQSPGHHRERLSFNEGGHDHKRPAYRRQLTEIPKFSNVKDKRKFVKFSFDKKKIIFGASVGNLLYGCLIGVLVPFFPGEAEVRGVSQTLIGGVFSVYALTQFIFSPIAGKLIPVFGATRVFHIGLITAGVSTVAFGLLDRIPNDTAFIVMCFVVRVVEAMGTAAFVTAVFAIVANQFTENVNMVIAVGETMCAVGIAIGPAIGGGLYSLGGYGLPFYTLGGTILACSLLNVWTMPWIAGDNTLSVNFRRMSRLFLSSYENWLNCLVLMVVSIVWTALDPGFAPYVTDVLGVTPAQIGLYFLLASGAYAIAGPIWGKLCDESKNTYIYITVSLTVAAVGLTLIAPTPILGIQPTWWLVGIGMTLRELFLGGAYIPTFGNMLHRCRETGMEENIATQAYVSSVWWSIFSIGNVVGPTAAGVLTDQHGFPSTVLVLSATTLATALPALVQAIRRGLRLRRTGGYISIESLSERGSYTARRHSERRRLLQPDGTPARVHRTTV